MNVTVTPRDYSLIGRDSKLAEELGLVSAEWYKAPIARKRLKELMQRSDTRAISDTLIWIAAFLVTGGIAVYFWPGWWSLPFFLAYGVLYGSSTDSRWHECGHGTAFKTRWMNDVIYQIACFMIMREARDPGWRNLPDGLEPVDMVTPSSLAGATDGLCTHEQVHLQSRPEKP